VQVKIVDVPQFVLILLAKQLPRLDSVSQSHLYNLLVHSSKTHRLGTQNVLTQYVLGVQKDILVLYSCNTVK